MKASPQGLARLLVLVLSVAATAVLGVGPAFAVSPVFSTSFGASGSGAGELSNPQDVAVDESTGDVYVADTGNFRVDKFDSGGNFILAFGRGVDQTSGADVCTAASGDTCQSGTPGFGGGGAFEKLSQIAVDNSGGPSSGAVYVGSDVYGTGGNRPFVSKFSSSGDFIFDINGTNPDAGWVNAGLGIEGLDVDPQGHLWLRNDKIYEFGQDGAFLQYFQTGPDLGNAFAGAASNPGGLGVNNGHVFDARGYEPIARYSVTAPHFQGVIGKGGVDGGQLNSGRGLALDQQTEDLYVTHQLGTSIDHYDAACIPVPAPFSDQGGCEVDDSFGSTHLTEPAGLTLDASTQVLYVADAGADNIAVFVPPPAGPPLIVHQQASEVASISATLKATINAMRTDTSCHLQYTDDATFQSQGFTGATALPCDPTDLGSRFADQSVRVLLSGLAPGTVYHYRFLASSSAGHDAGADRAIATEVPETSLPDGRAYEQVTPVDKDSTGVLRVNPSVGNSYQASTDGNRVAYRSFSPYPGSQSLGVIDLSTRGSAGWSTFNQIPPHSANHIGDFAALGCVASLVTNGNSSDLTKTILPDGAFGSIGCGHADPSLVANPPRGVQSLYLADNVGGGYQLISPNPVSGPPADANFQAGTPDLNHVIFDESAQLTADAPPGADNLYHWGNGSLHLLSIAPDGTPFPSGGTVSGADLGATRHVISDDGSTIFFQADGNLYARLGDSQTIQVDASQASGPGGSGLFRFASSDGSEVFFSAPASAGLTADTVTGSGDNLYRYDVGRGDLTDLTPNPDVEIRGIAGGADSGSDLYFVANGDLGGGATPGQPNLYDAHNGTLTFIATLDDSANSCVWLAFQMCARVTPDGNRLAFNSDRSLTATDTKGFTEAYLYDRSADQLTCATCPPTGAMPTGSAYIQNGPFFGLSSVDFLTRDLSADGSRLFFSSDGPLVGRDSNGQPDVYEWENGKIHLLSSGTARTPSLFMDASANGSDVFIDTAQQLLPSDIDGADDIYDARVGGGFPQGPDPQPCTGESCRPPASTPPGDQNAGSESNIGPGNQGKDVGRPATKPTKKKHKAKKKHKKHKAKKKHKARRANINRGGAK